MKKRKDYSFAKFFHPEKSPHTIFNPVKGVFDYVAIHQKRMGHVVWDSAKKGTYIFAKHGELK
jgi:hypothetical protein